MEVSFGLAVASSLPSPSPPDHGRRATSDMVIDMVQGCDDRWTCVRRKRIDGKEKRVLPPPPLPLISREACISVIFFSRAKSLTGGLGRHASHQHNTHKSKHIIPSYLPVTTCTKNKHTIPLHITIEQNKHVKYRSIGYSAIVFLFAKKRSDKVFASVETHCEAWC